jgi:hypothetical protein
VTWPLAFACERVEVVEGDGLMVTWPFKHERAKVEWWWCWPLTWHSYVWTQECNDYQSSVKFQMGINCYLLFIFLR